jgi:hypothetical protein
MELSYVETTARIESAAEEVASADHVEGLLIFATPADDGYDGQLESFLGRLDVPVIGGVFPELIHQNKKKEQGAVVCGLTVEPQVKTVPGLSDSKADYSSHLDPDLSVDGYETIFVFVDAYATEIERFVQSLFRTYGVELNYLGGGAGSLAADQQPCLFTDEGIVQDSAVVAAISSPLDLGVRHGWQEIAGPFRVTDTDGPVVNGLDGKPAFSVYRDVVEQQISGDLIREEFFETAKAYPFGISRMDGESIVRDPFEIVDENGLRCFGDVPEGEFVHILEGDAPTLIRAAQSAADEARSTQRDTEALFFFDCISRVLYLQEEFQQELTSVKADGSQMAGALTIGEIANDGNGHLDYYNKTAVVGAIGDI